MLSLEIPFDPGYTIAASVRRRADRFHLDAGTGRFQRTPPADADRLIPMAGPASGIDRGLYTLSYPKTSGWWDGPLLVAIHVLAEPGQAPGSPPSAAGPMSGLAVPRTHVTFEVGFANGGALYSPPPFLAY